MTIPTSESIFKIEEEYQVATYKKFPFAVAHGSDVWVYTHDGTRYLDLYGGHAVVSTGHCHPRMVKALSDQASRLIFYSNLVYSDVRASAARKLIEVSPGSLSRVFFVNSGTEANENAMKIARRFTGRIRVVSFDGGFHGRTVASLSATGIAKYRQGVSPLLDGHLYASFGDLESAERLIDDNTAAVILEPIQSMGGVRMGEARFYLGLRHACDRAGALLIYDEVQTGMGRTGDYFFAGRHDVFPDIISLAKGIGSGFPMGAVVLNERIASAIGVGDLGTTFGGGPMAAAALETTIDIIRDENLLENVRSCSAYLFDWLSKLQTVEEVRGLGYLIGIKFKGGDARPFQKALLDRKIITGVADDTSVLRLLPPLTLRRPEIEMFLRELSDIST